MANLGSVQIQIDILKSGDTIQKKRVMEPQNIEEVKKFIADKKGRPGWEAHEMSFQEWENLVARFAMDKSLVTDATANATANVVSYGAPVVYGQLAPSQSTGVREIQEKLSEINPNNLEQAIGISEQVIATIAEPAKSTLRGIHGAIIFDILRSAGHNLVIQNNQITIVPKPGTDVVNLQEKLQTLVNTKRLSLDTLKFGMLYSSPNFKNYVELNKTTDSRGYTIIDPNASPKDFLTYLQNLQKAGSKDGDIDAILKSRTLIQGVNMQQAIKGFQDLGQIGEWAQKNEKILKQADVLTGNINTNNPQQSAPSFSPSRTIPSEPNNTLTGKLVKDGVTGGHVTGVVGDSTKGLMNGIGDILSLGKGDPLATLGIGAALIYGVYKAFSKFGFLGGLGTLFGIGALNNIEKIMGRFGVDIGDTAKKAKTAAEEAAEKAKAAVTSAASGVTAPTTTNNTQKNAPALTPSQQQLRTIIMGNSALSADIDKLATAKNSKFPGKLDDYVKFIETDLNDVPLSKLFPSDHKESIFYDNFTSSLPGKSELSSKMLKRVLREYLTGKSALTGIGDKLGETEKEAFLKQHNILPADIQNKKFSNILESVNKVRTGGVVVPSPVAPVSAQSTSTPSAAPTTQKNTFKIAGVDKVSGSNVETSVNAPTFDAQGNPYSNTSTRLKIDSKGVIFAPAGSIVRLGSAIIQKNNIEHIEVDYAGEKVYVAITHLKP